MTDLSNVAAVMAWWLSEDWTIYARVQQADGSPAIIPGLQIMLADSYLDIDTNPTQTCIGVNEISTLNSVRAFYNSTPDIKSSQLIEVNVLSKVSEANSRELAALIDTKLQADMTATYAGSSYHFMIADVSRRPTYDDAGDFWRQAITIRGDIYY